MIFGERGVGKTTLCYSIVNSFLQDEGWALYVDAERSWDPDWASSWMPIGKVFVMRPDRGGGEAMVKGIMDLVRSDTPPKIVVVDSLSTVTSSDFVDRDLDKATMALDAKFNNRMVKVLNAVNKEVAFVIVNQARDGIGTWDYIPGGRGIQHMATLILQMRSSKLRVRDTDLFDGDPKDQVGILSRWRVEKYKLGQPYAAGYETLLIDGRLDLMDSFLRLALEKGLVVQAGAWYTLPDGTKVQGKAGIREWWNDGNRFERNEQ